MDDSDKVFTDLGRRVTMLAREHAVWSQVTFGSDQTNGPLMPLRHLEKEAREAQALSDDPEEYADCLLLVLDASRRAGIDVSSLFLAAREKLEVNKLRQWPRGVLDAPVEHVKD